MGQSYGNPFEFIRKVGQVMEEAPPDPVGIEYGPAETLGISRFPATLVRYHDEFIRKSNGQSQSADHGMRLTRLQRAKRQTCSLMRARTQARLSLV